ncbi:MAG: preQ(1) synthase [Candidatus Gracilibacteria bacterium]|nr:preQ(1) synthase [Candidatus Gracilibacteria bacterium]
MKSNDLYIEGKDFDQINIQTISAELKEKAPLETFGFQTMKPNGEHWISISTPEFTGICPFSNYPDFGSITIAYVPNELCLELKSFKLYINAFRDVKIFHESLTELIFHDFMEVVKPKKSAIIIDMNVRGNVKTVCRKYYKCSANDVEYHFQSAQG